jgi:ubiquinol-cytochrome c reductase cytochrome c1 subunit
MRILLPAMRNPMLRLSAGALVLVTGALATPAGAAEQVAPIAMSWQHDGLFGTYDRLAAQRGFQVYREVCSGCHRLDFVAFRNLADLGFSEEEVRAIAAEYTVEDGPDDDGEMFERPAVPADQVPPPYPNPQAARVANGGALPPDLSLITKARAEGTDYLYSLMVGYEEPPADAEGPEGMYYNAYFTGHWIAMPPPLGAGLIDYGDGTEATVEQMAADVTTFLTWAGEPTLEERKQTGLKVTLFLIVFTGLAYATMRKIWADAH